MRNEIISNSKFYYYPGQNLSLDECLIGFKGNHKLKVYIPEKSHKYGFKSYIITESETSYIWNLSLHNGNKKTIVEIVMPLVFYLEGENHRIYFDKFYSSLLLFSILKLYKIETIGTVMPNRLKVSK